MNQFINSFTLVMALTVPAIASAEVKLNQLTEEQVSVTYTADDAVSSSGRTALKFQIRRAAGKVCGSQNLRRAGSVRQLMENRNCYQKAVADALNSI